jgi:hypothetical protein
MARVISTQRRRGGAEIYREKVTHFSLRISALPLRLCVEITL